MIARRKSGKALIIGEPSSWSDQIKFDLCEAYVHHRLAGHPEAGFLENDVDELGDARGGAAL
jgi:hypothetical protein